MSHEIPVFMSFAGLDPTGGAGIQADIEAANYCNCHCTPVVTCIAVQNSHNILNLYPQPATLIIEQARAVLEDMNVRAFKLSLLPSEAMVSSIHTLLSDYCHIPVIFDPVLQAGGGKELIDDNIIAAYKDLILPLTTLITPNSLEAKRLAPQADNLNACAQYFFELGCDSILITDCDENNDKLTNQFYSKQQLERSFQWPRLPHVYHGSGCTLSGAITSFLSLGMDLLSAVHEAQVYTHNCLQQGYCLGQGQRFPNRLFNLGEKQ